METITREEETHAVMPGCDEYEEHVEIPVSALWKLLDHADRSSVAARVTALKPGQEEEIEGQSIKCVVHPLPGGQGDALGYRINGDPLSEVPAGMTIASLERNAKRGFLYDALGEDYDAGQIFEALRRISEDEEAFLTPMYAVWAEGGLPEFQNRLSDLSTGLLEEEVARFDDVASRRTLTPVEERDRLTLRGELARRL